MVKKNILLVGSKNLSRENWKVYHPSGIHMFTCGEKKAQWYLERSLAEQIGRRSIMFKFTPKGHGFNTNELFGRVSRKNICVVSGVDYGLQRHHIVPYSYRKYLPEKFKSKNHHDVVLINHNIHAQYEKEANKYKKELSEKYGIDSVKALNANYSKKLRELSYNYRILIGSIQTLLKSHGNKNPSKKISYDKKIELLNSISNTTDIDIETLTEFNYYSLLKLLLIKRKEFDIVVSDFKRNNKHKFDHAYHLISKLENENMIEEFIIDWRKHFIKTMKPKHMPIGWSINFRTKTEL